MVQLLLEAGTCGTPLGALSKRVRLEMCWEGGMEGALLTGKCLHVSGSHGQKGALLHITISHEEWGGCYAYA